MEDCTFRNKRYICVYARSAILYWRRCDLQLACFREWSLLASGVYTVLKVQTRTRKNCRSVFEFSHKESH